MKNFINNLSLKLHILPISIWHILAGFVLAGLMSLIFWDMGLGFMLAAVAGLVEQFIQSFKGKLFSFKLMFLVVAGAVPFLITNILIYVL